MFYYTHFEKHPDILKNAKKSFPFLFDLWLSEESIEVRYHLIDFIEKKYWEICIPEKNSDGIPLPIRLKNWETLYWSLSHTDWYGAFSISDTPTGIDIADDRKRDVSLFSAHSDEEYIMLWGKNWDNFYTLWTAKEAIIKQDHLTLDILHFLKLRELIDTGVYIFWLREKRYILQSQKHWELFLSVIISPWNMVS